MEGVAPELHASEPTSDNFSRCHGPASSALRRALPVSVVPTVFSRLTDDGPETTRRGCARATGC
jgi:hypothetical protein